MPPEQHHSLVHAIISFSMQVRAFNWGFVNFLFEVGLLIAGLIWVCMHRPALVGPLVRWTFMGLIIFLVLLVVAMAIIKAVSSWLNAKESYREEKIKYSKGTY